MDALDEEGVEHLLMAHGAEMRAAVALDRFADVARASARLERVLRDEKVAPATALRTRLEQAQVLVWTQNWDDAALVIDQAKEHAAADAENLELRHLDAVVMASTGRLEEALVVAAGIPEPTDQTALALLRHHADHLVEMAHAVTVGAQDRQERGVTTEPWMLQAAESMIDRAETLLRSRTDAGPDVLAPIVHRRAVLAWTRDSLGHSDDGHALHRSLLLQSLELFESAGQSHVPLAVAARRALEVLQLADQEVPDPANVTESGLKPPAVHLPPSGGLGTYPMAEYPWSGALALTRAVPTEARLLYGLIGATVYHLSGQAAPSSTFLALAFSTALRTLGLESRLLPATVRVCRTNGASLNLPAWESPPMVTEKGQVLGQITVWCEDAGRLVDPALLLGQSLFGPDTAEREIFLLPVVLPAPGLDSLLNVIPVTHRKGYRLSYKFRPDWEDRLNGVLSRLDGAAVDSFARVLADSAIMAADT
jgi:hypothetical protein